MGLLTKIQKRHHQVNYRLSSKLFALSFEKLGPIGGNAAWALAMRHIRPAQICGRNLQQLAVESCAQRVHPSVFMGTWKRSGMCF